MEKPAGVWLDIACIACTRGTPMLELGNTQKKSTSRAQMVVNSIGVCKIGVSCNTDVMASKEVPSIVLEFVNNSHPITSIRVPSTHSTLRFVPAPVTRAYTSPPEPIALLVLALR